MDLTILPLGFSNNNLLTDLIAKLRLIADSAKVLDLSIDLAKTYDITRRQYYSTQILELVTKEIPNPTSNIIILTEKDLYIPIFTYIFGEAQLNGKLSIVSTCRLHEEFYTSHDNYDLLLERTYKEILHELGHNFGLLHCVDWDCVMHTSAGIEELDVKGNNYCKTCKQKIL